MAGAGREPKKRRNGAAAAAWQQSGGRAAATAMDVGWPQPQRAGQPGLRCRPTQHASAVPAPPRDPSADVFLYVYWGALRVGRWT